MGKKEALINILLDRSASDAERDDAAIDLGNYNDAEVINILVEISNDLNIEDMIRATCGESLAHIWLRKEEIDYNLLFKLNDISLQEALSLIKIYKPNWYEKYKLLKSSC